MRTCTVSGFIELLFACCQQQQHKASSEGTVEASMARWSLARTTRLGNLVWLQAWAAGFLKMRNNAAQKLLDYSEVVVMQQIRYSLDGLVAVTPKGRHVRNVKKEGFMLWFPPHLPGSSSAWMEKMQLWEPFRGRVEGRRSCLCGAEAEAAVS